MSNEYESHRQCQTCYVLFSTSEELIDHIEEFRSAQVLLLAQLELCRLHLAPSDCDDTIDGAGDAGDNYKGKDGRYVSAARLDGFRCPFPGCPREDPFETRPALLRHFEQHIPCNEKCPLCGQHFRDISQFRRHACRSRFSNPTDPTNIFVKSRLTRTANTCLELSQKRTRDQAYGDLFGGSTRARKMAKMKQNPSPPAGAELAKYVTATETAMRSPNNVKLNFCPETNMVTSAKDSGWGFTSTIPKNDAGAWSAAVRPGMSTNATVPGMPTNDKGWSAAAAPGIPANDKGWSAMTASGIPTNDKGWPAMIVREITTNDKGWSAAAAPGIPANDKGWSPMTVPEIPINDKGWPAVTATGMLANNQGWFDAVAQEMPTNGQGWFDAVAPEIPSNDKGWFDAIAPGMTPNDGGRTFDDSASMIPVIDGRWTLPPETSR